MAAHDPQTFDVCDLLQLLTGADQPEQRELESRIFEGCTQFIESMARRYRNRGVADDDLLQVANLGMLKAIRGFDATRGNFYGYAKVTVLGELRKYFRDYAWVVRPSRGIQELQPRIRQFEAEFIHARHRKPTLDEIAAGLDQPRQSIVQATVSNGYFPVSLDAPYSHGRDDRSLSNTLADDNDAFDLAETLASITPIIQDLNDEQKTLLRLRFIEDRSQADIGDALGLSQMQVSRCLAALLATIRDHYGDDELPIAA